VAWCNEVQSSLVYGKVHKFDAELRLNLGLGLNSLLNDSAHLFNGVHFGLLCDLDPVIQLFVESDGRDAGFLETLQ